MSFNWDQEVTLTLTVRDLYYLQHAADSVITMGEVSNFTVGYEPISSVQYDGFSDAIDKVIAVLKENKNA